MSNTMETKRQMVDVRHIESAVELFAELADSNKQQVEHFEDTLPDVADWHKARAEAYELCADRLGQYVANLAEQI